MVDIIFIHGFIRNSINVWRHSNGAYWPTDFLLRANAPPARVITFGYSFHGSCMTLKDIENPERALNRGICVMRAGDNSLSVLWYGFAICSALFT